MNWYLNKSYISFEGHIDNMTKSWDEYEIFLCYMTLFEFGINIIS
jgi:hypothetical protein